MSIDLIDACCEEEAARLLPWYVVGRLSAGDVERVERHLAHCAICRADLAHERNVRALLKSDTRVEHAPQAGLAKTLARIDELGREAPAPVRPAPAVAAGARRTPAMQWLTAALVVQTIGIGILGGVIVGRKPAEGTRAEYALQSSGGSAIAGSGHLRAVFAATLTLSELKSLLLAQRLTIVRGPSEAGVYTLAAADAIGATGLNATVASLRGDPRVLFVERAVNDETAAR